MALTLQKFLSHLHKTRDDPSAMGAVLYPQVTNVRLSQMQHILKTKTCMGVTCREIPWVIHYLNVLRMLGPEAKYTIIIRLLTEMCHHYCMDAMTVYGMDVISNKNVLNWETLSKRNEDISNINVGLH